MERKIAVSADGSHTIFDPASGEHFHSMHGAVAESMHVFIRAGLEAVLPNCYQLNILELGFGTGLNALLTLMHPLEGKRVFYHAIEKYPLDSALTMAINHPEFIPDAQGRSLFFQLHNAPWEQETEIGASFTLLKTQLDLLEFRPPDTHYDLVYFDAFSPAVQPELWTTEVFARLFAAMRLGSKLVTYSARGSVKQALRAAGFVVERLPGPAGKRHVLRAGKG